MRQVKDVYISKGIRRSIFHIKAILKPSWHHNMVFVGHVLLYCERLAPRDYVSKRLRGANVQDRGSIPGRVFTMFFTYDILYNYRYYVYASRAESGPQTQCPRLGKCFNTRAAQSIASPN